jgi:protein phosphatase
MSHAQSVDDSFVVAAQAIHIGYGDARKTLEDACEATVLRMADGSLLHVGIVADGMGGIEGGDVASRVAVTTTLSYLQHGRRSELPEALDFAIQAAQAEVLARRQQYGFERMGTTLTITAITADNLLYLAHVGDSRAYLVRNGQITQLTTDHSWGNIMVRGGKLSPEEAEAHERSSALVQYIGRPDGVEVDLALRLNANESDEEAQRNQGLLLQTGDAVVLCSDGLIKNRPYSSDHFVEPKEIARIASKMPPAEAVRKLIELALMRQVDDNVSVVIMTIPDRPAVSLPVSPEVHHTDDTMHRPHPSMAETQLSHSTMPGGAPRPVKRAPIIPVKTPVIDQPRRVWPRWLLIGAAAAALLVVAGLVAVLSKGEAQPAEEEAPGKLIYLQSVTGSVIFGTDSNEQAITAASPLTISSQHFIRVGEASRAVIALPDDSITLYLDAGTTVSLALSPDGESSQQTFIATLYRGRVLVYYDGLEQPGFTLEAPPGDRRGAQFYSLEGGSSPPLPWAMAVEYAPGERLYSVDCLHAECTLIAGIDRYPLFTCTRLAVEADTLGEITPTQGAGWLGLGAGLDSSLFCLEAGTDP